MVEINKDCLMVVIIKEYPSAEDRQLVAQYLRSIGGCPHLAKKTIIEKISKKVGRKYDVCLDCGAENI